VLLLLLPLLAVIVFSGEAAHMARRRTRKSPMHVRHPTG
jgi:hypothetical protein